VRPITYIRADINNQKTVSLSLSLSHTHTHTQTHFWTQLFLLFPDKKLKVIRFTVHNSKEMKHAEICGDTSAAELSRLISQTRERQLHYTCALDGSSLIRKPAIGQNVRTGSLSALTYRMLAPHPAGLKQDVIAACRTVVAKPLHQRADRTQHSGEYCGCSLEKF